jgi:hypothetical protein
MKKAASCGLKRKEGLNMKIEKVFLLLFGFTLIYVIGVLSGGYIKDQNFSKTMQNINNKIQIAEAGKRIRWGFFPDSSIVEIRFSNNKTPNCIIKDNVIRISPMTNSVFCEVKLLSKTGL